MLPMNEELLKYFTSETNRRLEEIENKIDSLLELRAQMFMLAGVISVVVAGGVQLIVKVAN